MKIAVLSDAHGNSLALEICLKYIINDYKADKIFFLGDAVGYYSDYTNVLNLLIKNVDVCLSGNHEAMLLGNFPLDATKDGVYGINKNKTQLTDSHLSFLKNLRPFYELNTSEKILFVHGSPYDPLNGYVYPDTEISHFSFLPYDVIFMGHTHRPFIKKIGGKTIVNIGSCGLPRDEGTLLSFATYDTEKKEVEILRKYLKAEDVISFYGKDKLNETILNCLHRKSDKQIIGRVI